ncbi:MAG: PIN domain-containing protein [Nitrospiraceae bacterium]|nr:PIN domain-containing protein [Nitrospiraceae bacterium]
MKLPEKLVDANVILRFFLEDDEEQLKKTRLFFQRVELAKEEALITDIIFAEVVWVLHKVYDIPRPEIAEKFSRLINYKGIKTVFRKELYAESLGLYAKHPVDIQDILLSTLARDQDCTVVTFDKGDFRRLQCRHTEP